MANAAGPAKLATLTVSGNEYNVLQASFEAIKPVDKQNRQAAYCTKAEAKFTLEGTSETYKLFELFANKRDTFDCELVLNNTHAEGQLTKISYSGVSISYFAEDYSSTSETPYTVCIGISPKQTKQNGAELNFLQSY